MKRTVVISDNQMKLARKLNMGRKPVLLVVAILSMAASLHGQDVLKANPEFWGRNAFHANSTSSDATAEASNEAASAKATQQHQTVSHQATPSQVSAIVNSARAAEKKGDPATARALYEQALQHDPINRVALLSFARMLHRTGELDASIGMYYRSLEHHRDDPVAMNDLALCYARKGELRHALAMMNGAISIKPDSARYRNNVAKVLLELNRPTDAFAHLVEANGPTIGHYNMAKLLGQRGQTAEAIQYLEIATQMDPTFEPAAVLLSQVKALPKTTVTTTPKSIFTRLPAVESDESTETDSTATGSAPTVDMTTALAGALNTDSANNSSENGGEDLSVLPPVSSASSTAEDGFEAATTAPSTASLEDPKDTRSVWEPGSIRLQSAELVDELNEGAVDWAADFEELELSPTTAPIPFENQRRYTETKDSADSVGKFLDGFK